MLKPVYLQSAVIPYRRDAGSLSVLLVSNLRRTRWVIPKGLIEQDMTPAASAEKEALEEAGITGHVYPDPIGTYTYNKWGGACHVDVFLMKVLKQKQKWDEASRTRLWMRPDDAGRLIDEPGLRLIMSRVEDLVAILDGALPP